MTMQPRSARYSIEDTGSGLCLEIPSRRNWFQILIFSAWFVFWIFFVFNFFSLFLGPFSQGSTVSEARSKDFLMIIPFMLAWITGWVAGGLYVLYSLFWQLVGYEIIEMTPATIKIARKAMGFERPKTYDVSYVRDLRVVPYEPQTSIFQRRRTPFFLRNAGALAFDYGADTIRFGDMEEAEAKMALADILRRYPGYAHR